MYDILEDLEQWRVQGERIGVATVIGTWGSSPRAVGSKMVFTLSGKLSGSVSGGCVEGAVIEIGKKVLKTGVPQLLHFDVADDTAWNVGLTCGGQLDVYVQLLDLEGFALIRSALMDRLPIVLVTVIQGAQAISNNELIYVKGQKRYENLGEEEDEIVSSFIKQLTIKEGTKRIQIPTIDSTLDLFLHFIPPPPILVILGGVHISIALVKLAKTLGFQTVVIDPRRSFGNHIRFPDVDILLQDWPVEALNSIDISEDTCVVALTHDPKLDDPALIAALNSPAFYVGAMGNQKTQKDRRARLLGSGVPMQLLERLHGPIGLDIGSQTPEEIALSILAEIVAVRRGYHPKVIQHQTIY